MKIIKLKETRITSVFFPKDDGNWTDLIISSFSKCVFDSQIPVKFTNISWSMGESEESLIEDVAKSSPDIIFLPDDLLYKRFGKRLQDRTGAFVIFIAFQSKPEDLKLLPRNKQAGVYNEQPIKELVDVANKMFDIRSIGVIGGPWSGEMISRIKESLPSVKIEALQTDNWPTYSKTAKNFATKHDAVWALAPFGVIDETGKKWVSDERVQAMIDLLDKPVLGWGNLSKLRRTIEMSISPKTIGIHAGYALINALKKDHIAVEEISTHGIKINELHMKKLNIKIPDELIGTIISI